MDLNKKLEELKPYQLNCNVFDVYSYNGLSMQELLCQFFTKINECITVSNETIDLAKWLVNEGLEIEVVKKLMIWLEDGTLENIINVNLFNTLNEKINGLSSQLEHNKNEFVNIINNIEGVSYLDECIISFLDDDCSRSFLTKLKPVFDMYGIRCSLGLITDNIGTSINSFNMTLAELKELQKEGYDILCHTKTHDIALYRDDLINVDEKLIENDMIQAREFMIKNGFSGYNTLVWAYGGYTGDVALKMKGIARRIFKNAINSTGNMPYILPFDNMLIGRSITGISSDSNVSWLKQQVDVAKQHKSWFIIGTHSFDNVDLEKVAEVISYIKSKDIKIMTVSEALSYKGNLLSLGEYTANSGKLFIGANGVTKGDPVKIGAVNLLQDTKKMTNSFWENTNHLSVTRVDDDFLGLTSYKLTSTWQGLKQKAGYLYLENGKQYTISFYAKSDVEGVKIGVYSTTPHGNILLDGELNTWKRYSLTFNFNNNTGFTTIYPSCTNITDLGGTVYICGMQLETGVCDTDYKQNQSDIERLITG